jgi:hypothetical protein
MYYILVTCEGDVYTSPEHKGNYLGNVLKNNVKLYTEPKPYGGHIDGTVDGISSFLETNYKELEGNHVISFAKQGGVYKENGNVIYKNLFVDFNKKTVRDKYRFPDGFTKLKLLFYSFKP